MSFSLQDAINLQTEKGRRHNKVMDKLVSNAKERIKYHAQMVGNSSCTYEVPPFISGMCLYNITEAVKYIIETLLEEGYVIRNLGENKIWICWDKNVIRYKEKIEPNREKNEQQQTVQDNTYINYLINNNKMT